ncbi:MAG TPA: hypothetical protein PK210_12815 [Bacteroidia bacterium]|nr:hypothetical protein [Bacteroidia bacterium]
MPYQKSTSNNEVTFSVQPEKHISTATLESKIYIGCFSVLLAAAPGGFLISTGHTFLAVITFVVVIFLIRRFTGNKAPKGRVDKTFVVTPDSVKIDGKTFTKENIQRIIIRNAFDNLHNNFSGEMRQMAERTYQGAASVNYRVDIESNGTPITIAVGLNEPTANAILTDVCGILGMTIS